MQFFGSSEFLDRKTVVVKELRLWFLEVY